jgi:hypothetical protein
MSQIITSLQAALCCKQTQYSTPRADHIPYDVMSTVLIGWADFDFVIALASLVFV